MHTDFQRAFTDGLTIDQGDELLRVSVVKAGRIQIHGGTVLVGDPGWVKGLETLPVGIPRGKYQAELSRVRSQDQQTGEVGERVAAMRLLLGKMPAARWLYLATVAVDTGAVAFLTPSVADLLERQQQEAAQRYEHRLHGDDDPEPEDSIDTRLQQGFARDLIAPVLLQSHSHGPFDFVACSSGFGDGRYDVYVGLDERGEVVELVVDFAVLLEPIFDQVIIEDIDALPPGAIDLGFMEDLGIHADHGRPTETWLAVDASALWDDPLRGRPEIIIQSPDGQRLYPPSSMVAGHHRIDAPGVRHAQVTIKVRVGVKPL
ncbi:MAG: DUF4241 domain-containing protein [Oligoflexia bacterium]|nr:DUF4241 domain-containing protein [Oligoflexia bacterium]